MSGVVLSRNLVCAFLPLGKSSHTRPLTTRFLESDYISTDSRSTNVQDAREPMGFVHLVSDILPLGPHSLVPVLQGQDDPTEKSLLPTTYGRLDA